MDFLKWLYPGLGIKRWLALGVVGFIMVSVGMAIINNTPILGICGTKATRLVFALLACLCPGRRLYFYSGYY